MSVSPTWGPCDIDSDVLRARAQRQRFMTGIAEVLQVKAYDQITVADVCRQVGASRRTFYECFDDKLDCLLAAYDGAITAGLGQARRAFDAEASWADGIAAAVDGLLGAMAWAPAQARLCAIEILACGHAGRERHSRTLDAVAGIIDLGAAEAPADLELPRLLGRAAAGAGFSMIYEWVSADRVAELPQLAPQLTSIILVPYIGRAAGARVATGQPLRLAG
jgi:AcrR family transcriptional regulator